MNSPNHLLPKFTSLLAIGACLLTTNHLPAAGEVTAGYQFGGAISEGKLRTWGLNDSGQLGQGEGAPNPNPLPTEISDTVSYIAAEAGPDFMFGITTNNELKSWGKNDLGQLGIGSTADANSPQSINFQNGATIRDVAAGSTHALAIGTDNLLYAWGDISSGQLGISVNGLGYTSDPFPDSLDDTVVESPLLVLSADPEGLNTWLDVAAGLAFSVGIKTDGTLWVWGGAASSLGLTGNFSLPDQIATNITDWVEVEAGVNFVIARRANGQIYTWGSNAVGALGLGQTVAAKMAPTRVGNGSDWIAIGAGDYTAFAIDSNNTLYGWGYNLDEELGQLVYINTETFQLVNGFIYTPVEISSANTFTEVDGGLGTATGDIGQNEGFTITRGNVNSEDGFFTLGGNINGQLGVGTISFDTSHTPQRAAADGLEILISAPSLTDTDIGVNSQISVDVTVSNDGSVNIQVPYLVELFLSTDDEIGDNDTLLASRLTNNPLPVGSSNEIPFADVSIGVFNPGDYFIISRVSFDGAPQNTNADIKGTTAVTISQPSFVLDNPVFPVTKIELGEDFTGVDITLRNNTIGIVPEGEAIVLEVYLLEDLQFDPVTDVIPPSSILLAQIDYTGGLNSVIADANATPPATYTFENLTLSPPGSFSSRENYLILFAVNREGDIGEDTGQTEDNYKTQAVVISSPDPVAPAINFGAVTGIGDVGEWSPVFDKLALNNNALQSPALAQAESASFEMQVSGPTTFSAPWTIDAANNDILKVELIDADGDTIQASGGGDFSIETSGYNPSYSPVFIIVDAESALYSENIASAPYPWTVRWTYTQGSTFASSFARVDLEIPSFVPDTDTLGFLGADDPSAPTGGDLRVARTLDIMAQGDAAVLKFDYDLTNNALVKFWWRTNGDVGLDTLSFSVDGVVQQLPTYVYDNAPRTATISGNTGWQQVAFIVGAGPRTFRWEFKKGSSNPLAAAFIDGLEVLEPLPENNLFNRTNPELVPVLTDVNGAGEWQEIINTSAPNEMSVAIAGVAQGNSVSFSYDLLINGPTVVYAPWALTGDASDTVSYKIQDSEGDYIQTPEGVDFIVEQVGPLVGFVAQNIVINADSELYDADSINEPYPWLIEWTYTQNSANPDSSAQVAVTPYNYQFIPESNVDMKIESVTATPGTYILDDANGTGRLPISVSMKNIGADFESLPTWDPTNLQIHLSTDQVFGNNDDYDIGSFGQVEVLQSNNQIVFQSDINLPFNLPEGNYYVLLRFDSSFDAGEFTLANNSRVVGPNFNIVRAPNLVIRGLEQFSSSYPWRPEQSSYIRYYIANTGLGDVTSNEPFNVTVVLRRSARGTGEIDLQAEPIKVYDPIPNSLFLPQASAQFPDGSAELVTHYLEIPPIRDILVALGAIPEGTAEDNALVYSNQDVLDDFEYYFTVTVDSEDSILESSETNIFFTSKFFNIVPVDLALIDLDGDLVYSATENYGFYVGHFPFSRFTIRATRPLTNPFDDSDLDGYDNLTEYAFAMNPTSASSLFNPTQQNGVVQLNIAPHGNAEFLSITFDFNVRMTDLRMIVQGSDNLLGPWEDLLTIEPPFLEPSGAQSLTGFGGLLSDPRVISVVGNVTDVQDVYSARISVRDTEPFTGIGSRFMRVLTESTDLGVPPNPTDLDGGVDPETFGIRITWNGTAYDPGAGINGAFHIERSTTSGSGYELIGISNISDPDNGGAAEFIDTTAKTNVTYFYRVRTVSTAGVTPYAINNGSGNPYVAVTISTQ